MENIVDFSVIKEKIIKTDELINLYGKTQNQLKKLQATFKQSKECPGDFKNEIIKLKATNDSVNNTLDCMRQKISSLETENYQLSVQYKSLEDKYNEQIIKNQLDCQKYTETLNAYKVELNLYKPDEKKLEKKSISNKKLKDLQEECKKYKNLNIQLTEELTQVKNTKTKLENDVQSLQLILNNQNNKSKNKQEELRKLNDLNNRIKFLELENETLFSENNKLIEKLNTKRISVETQTENSFTELKNDLSFNYDFKLENKKISQLCNNEICNYFNDNLTNEHNIRNNVGDYIKEMTDLPSLMSPLNSNSPEDDNSMTEESFQKSSFHIPNIVITPPTPAVKQNDEFDGAFKTYTDSIEKKRRRKNNHKRFKIIRINPKPAKNRILVKRNLRRNNDNILDALLTLKKHNLNFTITNSTIPMSSTMETSTTTTDSFKYSFTPPQTPVFLQTRNDSFTEKLSCKMTQCLDESYMLLNKKSNNDVALLGFFDVKNEPFSRSHSRLNNNNTMDVKETNNKCDITTSDKLLNTLADLVSEKLKNKNVIKKKRLTKRIVDYNSLNSETESKLENVFYKDSNELPVDDQKLHFPDFVSRLESKINHFDESRLTEKSAHECPVLLSPIKSVKGSPRLKNKQLVRNTYETRQRTRMRLNSEFNNSKIVPTNEELFGSCTDSENGEQSNSTPLKRKRKELNCLNKKKSINKVQNVVFEKDESKKPVVRVENTKTISENGSKVSNKPLIVVQNAQIEKKSFKKPVQLQRKLNGIVPIRKVAVISNDLNTNQNKIPCNNKTSQENVDVHNFNDCPQSPEPEETNENFQPPKLIPLDAQSSVKLAPATVEMLFKKLITYATEEKVVEEVVTHFVNQKTSYISECILLKVSLDIYDNADSKYTPPAPLLTETQRILLGFMSCLENNHVVGVFDSFLEQTESKLFAQNCNLIEIVPITRLYMAVCKLRKDLNRIRRFCCEAFYFMGDLAVPLFFTVLTSWIEVMPKEIEMADYPLAKVLVQIVHLKECNKPGYNLMPLRKLLNNYYGYPMERWHSDDIFQDLYDNFLRKPTRMSDFAILLFCKNHPTKWVYKKIQDYFKKIVEQIVNENFKATVIILIGNICSQFDAKCEYDANVLQEIRKWLLSIADDTIPVIVRKSIILSLRRLPKQTKKKPV